MEIGHNKPATKLVEVRLSAITRMEYMEVVEVPANITADELNKLVNERYQKVDGGEFAADPEYWERGSCYATDSDMPGATPSLMAFRTEHGLHVERADGQYVPPEQPKLQASWLPVREFAQKNRCSLGFIEAMEAKLVPVLPQGLQGTTSGFEATVLGHYHDGMYLVRVPGGEKCISWQDLEFEGKLEDNSDPDYWYIHRHELEAGQVFKLNDGSVVMLESRVPGDGTKWYVKDWNEGWSFTNHEIEPGDLRGQSIPNLPSYIKHALGQ